MRYGEYPVSLYTGLVDISIPVYTIDVKGIKVPVEFKYHASGIKYDDKSLEVGLGWTLMAGGVISYTTKGNPDPKYSISPSYIPFRKDRSEIDPLSYCNDYNPVTGGYNDNYYMRKISLGETSSTATVDGESDTYSYSFLQYSGKFFHYYEHLNLFHRETVFVPANSLRLITESGGIELADKEGITYLFTELERGVYPEIYHSQYLTKIISADKCDTIYFNYTKYNPESPYMVSRPTIKGGFAVKEIMNFYYETPYYDRTTEYGGTMDIKSYYPPRLENITFRGGRIVFEYNSIRDLRFVKIYNNIQTTPLQTISLEKSNFTNGEQKLDKVVFSDNNGNNYDYRFEYNGNPPANPSGIDYWGYYNGVPANPSTVYMPSFKVSVQTGYFYISGLDRSASESYMKYGVLSKIIYPTKGYTVFSYEAHRVYNPPANGNMLYGGLRIKEICNYNSDGSLAGKKWYQYEGARGILPPIAYQTDNAANNFIYYCTQTRFLEHKNDFIDKITDRNNYSAFPKRNAFSSGSSVVYSQVTEYAGNQTADYGKTVHLFSDWADEEDDMIYRSGSSETPVRSFSWRNGQLISKKVFRKESNGQYTEISSLTNEYKDINTAEYQNLKVNQYVYASDVVLQCFNIYQSAQYIGNSPFDYYNYYLNTGLYVLDNSVIAEDGVAKKVFYDEYNSYGLPTKVRTILSSGSSQTVQTKYPSDFSYSPYTQMVAGNILSPVIEESVYKDNNTFLKKAVTAYNNWGNNLFAPQYIQLQNPTGPLETRITYHNYDSRGNPVHISKDGADKIVYLWGYNSRFPVAEIRNVAYSDIVPGKITEATLKTIAEKNEPSTSDWSLIEGLRTSLPQAYITTYKYKPLIGLVWMKDPREVVTVYDYDNFGRLKIIRDNNNNPVEEYKYHYQN